MLKKDEMPLVLGALLHDAGKIGERAGESLPDIAAAWNELPLDQPFCALVKGDLSGMQEFLYLLTSDGAARGLRGRSFYLQLLTETVAGYVLRQFRLTEANLLFAGGGDRKYWTNIKPTRLLVRDIQLTEEEKERLSKAKLDLPYTEVKWEAAIDRITSAAVPRQNERVPAGAVFGPFEFVYSLYDVDGAGAKQDAEWLRHVFEGMELIEDDYIGGYGSRGAGKIAFDSLNVIFKSPGCYKGEEAEALWAAGNLGEVKPAVFNKISELFAE